MAQSVVVSTFNEKGKIMTLAQVQGVVAAIAALILSWAGLLMATALVLPVSSERARQALEVAPRRCFWNGLALLAVFAGGIVLLSLPFPPAKLAGVALLLGMGGLFVVGASGLSYLMGQRIGEMSGAKTSFGMLARGSLLYGVASLFPLIGWYLFLPLSILFSLGAGKIALTPEPGTMSVPPKPASTPDFDLAGR